MIKILQSTLKYLIIGSFLMIFTKITHAEEFGTKDEALSLLERAIGLVKEDKTRALNLFSSGDGGLNPKDLYPFCITSYGMIVGHPTLEGLDILNFKDPTGKEVGKEMLSTAKYGEVNEVSFMIARLTTDDQKLYKKTQLVVKVADLTCAVGFYSE